MLKIPEIHSGDAWIMFCVLLFVAYFLRVWFPTLPFLEFATYLVAGFGAFLTKRHYKGKLECTNGETLPQKKAVD